MRNFWIAAGLAAIVAAPSLAQAGTACRQERKGNEVAGTVIGAVAGGVLGNAISHGRDRGLATAAGAVGGGYLGNRIAASSSGSCPDGYVAYDDGATDQRGRSVSSGYQQQPYANPQTQPYNRPVYRSSYESRAGEPGWSRDGDHHDWNRETFDRDYGQHGAEWDHRWNRGERLPDGYAQDQRYVVSDYRHHHLPRPSRGYHWVRYGSSYVQVRNDGYINRTIYNSRY